MRGQAHAAQIGNDQRALCDHGRGERRPHVARVGKAVQHHDRCAGAAHPHVQRGAVDLHLFDTHPLGERLDGARAGNCRDGKKERGEERRQEWVSAAQERQIEGDCEARGREWVSCQILAATRVHCNKSSIHSAIASTISALISESLRPVRASTWNE